VLNKKYFKIYSIRRIVNSIITR